MEPITFLTLNFIMVAFLFLSYQDKFVYDFVFAGFAGIMSLFLAFLTSTYSEFTQSARVFLILIYAIFALALFVYSTVMAVENMHKGI
jgi:hypothetical protein